MRFYALASIAPLVFILAAAHAQECTISAENSDEFLFEVYVQEDGSTKMDTIWKIPYTKECVAEKGLEDFIDEPIECQEEIVSDVLFRSTNFFVISSQCFFSFEEETQHLLIKTSSFTEKIATEENGEWSIRFEKWEFEAPVSTSNSMKIFLPANGRVISYFPKKNGEQRINHISWEPVPKEPVGLKYSMPIPLEKNPLALGATLLVVLGALAIIVKKAMDKHKVVEKIKTLQAKKSAIEKEEKEMQVAYLKRRIDEQTFKKRVGELEEEKSEVDIEEKTIEEKEKPAIGKGRLRRMRKEAEKEEAK